MKLTELKINKIENGFVITNQTISTDDAPTYGTMWQCTTFDELVEWLSKVFTDQKIKLPVVEAGNLNSFLNENTQFLSDEDKKTFEVKYER
jgi:hypothetical protein